jgi:hypothetical protein
MVSSFGHNRGSTVTVEAFEEGQMRTIAANGNPDCINFKTYLDLRTGEIKATTIWKRVWRADSNGTVVRASVNCEIDGECIGDVAIYWPATCWLASRGQCQYLHMSNGASQSCPVSFM